jgi:hypothetical protein
VDELLALVEVVTGLSIPREHFPARPGDVDRVVLDIEMLCSLVPFAALPLDGGLRRTWAATMNADHIYR